MKLTEKQIHLLFKIGVLIKGIDGALEVIAGFALLFATPGSLRNLVGWLTQGELQEDPTDFVANHLVDFSTNSPSAQNILHPFTFWFMGLLKSGWCPACCAENCGLIQQR